MKVSDLFDVAYGQNLELYRLTRSNGRDAINFVGRSARNNGVTARVAPLDGVTPCEAETLTVALGGSVLETFVQPHPFYTAFHVYVLTPTREMTLEEKLWWAICIRANRYRYNYGRQANRTLADLDLPDDVPDWISPAFRTAVSGVIAGLNEVLTSGATAAYAGHG